MSEPYDPKAWPPFAVTVDLVLLTVRSGRLETVLVRRDVEPHAGRWALPGGFVGPDEGLDDAVRRVFAAKTGLEVPYVEQLGTYGQPDRDPRMRVVSVAYLVLLASGALAATSGDAGWFPVDTRPGGLAFDHDRILDDAVERARSKLEYTTLAAVLCGGTFTIPELRATYEAVWGVPLHPGNFHRKVRSIAGFVEPAGGTGRGGAQLFRRGASELMMPPLMRPAPG